MYVYTHLNEDNAQVEVPILGYGHGLRLTASLIQSINRWVLDSYSPQIRKYLES